MAIKVVAEAFGGPEVLAVVDEAVPDPGPGQVSVEVRSAGTNPIDYKQFSGQLGADPSRLPMPVGLEAAGVVTAVGAGATGPGGPVRPGDEVILYRISGAYASQVVVAASAAVAKPPPSLVRGGRRSHGDRGHRGPRPGCHRGRPG